MGTPTDLIICIGNVARGDDGVAHRVASLLRETPGIGAARILSASDLDIAMAEEIASAAHVVLVDAERRDGPPVRMRDLRPGPTSRPTGHTIDAESLLGLALALYDAAPPTTLVSVAAPDMGHSERLSSVAEAAAQEAAAEVVRYLELVRGA